VPPASELTPRRGDTLAQIIATSVYIGDIRFAPGTFGTIPGLFLFVIASMLGLPAWLFLACIAGLFAVGVWAASRSEIIFGKKDDGRIVIDEVVGAMITMFMLPLDWRLLIAGFFAFRFFDILKPGFRRLEKIKGGLGIMIDDVAAGIMANISLRILLYVVQAFYS